MTPPFKKATHYLTFMLGLGVCLLVLSGVFNFTLKSGILLLLLFLIGFFLFLKPFYGFLAVLFLRSTLELLGIQALIEETSLTFNGLLGLLVIGWSCWLAFKKKEELRRVPGVFLLSGFCFLGFLSLFWSVEPSFSLREAIRILSIFGIYLAGFLLILTPKKLKKLFYVLVSAGLVQALIAFWQLFTQRGLVVYGEYFRRVYGSLAYPNSLGFLMVFLGALLLPYFKQKQSLSKKIFGAAIVLLFSITLFLTYTRGAWLGFLLIFVLFGLFKYPRLLFGGLVFLLLLYLVAPSFGERLIDIVRLEPFGSFMWRVRLWQRMLPWFFKRPVLGWGIGSFPVLAKQVSGLSPTIAPEAHNDYLRVLVELGTLGLLVYLAIYLRILTELFYRWKKAKEKTLKGFTFIMMLVFLSFFLMAAGDNILRGTAVQWFLWAWTGGLLGILQRKDKSSAN